MPKARLMQGNEACAEGALAAGLKFYAGYPITPSTEIAEYLADKLVARGGRFIQMEDEIASMGAVVGGSLTGLKSMTATSGPGFSLKQENLGYAIIAEVPCVVVNVQRAGPSTGLPTSPAQGDIMQARWGTHGDHPIIALCPSSVRESFDLTVRAFNLAEKYRIPVLLMLDEVIGHMREKIEIPDASEFEILDRAKPTVDKANYKPNDADASGVPPLAAFGSGYKYHVTGLTHDRAGFPTSKPAEVDFFIRRLHNKIDSNLDGIITYEEIMTEDAEVIVVAYGCTARSAKAAVNAAREQGIKVGLFRPITIWPFPEAKMKELSADKKVIVAELNLGQLSLEVERVIRKDTTNVHRVDGEMITPDDILEAIKGVR